MDLECLGMGVRRSGSDYRRFRLHLEVRTCSLAFLHTEINPQPSPRAEADSSGLEIGRFTISSLSSKLHNEREVPRSGESDLLLGLGSMFWRRSHSTDGEGDKLGQLIPIPRVAGEVGQTPTIQTAI